MNPVAGRFPVAIKEPSGNQRARWKSKNRKEKSGPKQYALVHFFGGKTIVVRLLSDDRGRPCIPESRAGSEDRRA